ncbi:Domain of unknown function DUF2786 [uncultured Caudovirales phage]|uniref:Uncharacterized protein n=1 Tax=uncultured Caudovirales phage TaxID=2100421 RepID=A0A6J5PI05_9CAUD|nr:Domain of unknown function DUF2786 [uncultured Caudovirales phage]CAB4182372.1 Domain of unknown function DUF2786 [uncultured Caudovirales phage]CAB4213905.1 Domain of unknown function DUF2786 [uncultured Caudovirales phage]CAB5228415.1 Domain of unknown function DUF2786 [uncultured Caudovirales phage]
MNNERNERRQRMLEKVRKLLAMGRDGRGNDNENDIAMRQANKIMAEYGIAEAECDMSAIDAGEMVFGEAQCGPDGRAPEQGKIYRAMPSYAGVLAIGIGRFCDAIVGRKTTANGEMLTFRGEQQDVLLARWIFGVLVNSILAEQRKSGWTARSDANSFRMAAASTLQRRLKELADERIKMYEEAKAISNSRALVVVDRKRNEIVARFGEQKVKSTRAGYRSSGAAMAGTDAGRRINIPAGRPIAGSSQAQLH